MCLDDYNNINLLVDKVKKNDSDALWQLFDYYQPVINIYVNNTHSKYKNIEKDDLKSECIFILKHLCEKYDKNKSYFSYYLNTRLQPYLISKVKSKYLEKIDIVSLNNIDESELIDDYFNMDLEKEEYSILDNKINALPEIYKKAIDLFYFQELTQIQCSVILKISQPAFNKRLKKALKLLKEN